MRLRTLILTLVVPALSLPTTHTAFAAPVPSADAESWHSRVAPDSARMQLIMTKVDSALRAGRIKDARNLYRTLIEEQRASEQYAGGALWRLAETYFAADDARGAARVLDEVADAAARFGDPAMELRATFESALLYQRLRSPTAVAFRLPRIKALLQSPAVSQEQKEEIKRRMAS